MNRLSLVAKKEVRVFLAAIAVGTILALIAWPFGVFSKVVGSLSVNRTERYWAQKGTHSYMVRRTAPGRIAAIILMPYALLTGWRLALWLKNSVDSGESV